MKQLINKLINFIDPGDIFHKIPPKLLILKKISYQPYCEGQYQLIGASPVRYYYYS